MTPELVAPLNPNQVAYLPGVDHIAPNDWELFGLGKIDGEGRPGEAAPAPPRPRGEATRAPAMYGVPSAARLRGPIGPAGGNEGT